MFLCRLIPAVLGPALAARAVPTDPASSLTVGQAQVLQAGLLPNLQSYGAVVPLVTGFGKTQAWNAGTSEEIRSRIPINQPNGKSGL
jgi:hypothetical protein